MQCNANDEGGDKGGKQLTGRGNAHRINSATRPYQPTGEGYAWGGNIILVKYIKYYIPTKLHQENLSY